MNMTSIDWAVTAAVLGIFIFTAAVLANRLTRSVSDYLVAGRCAGRYMLTIASGMEWTPIPARSGTTHRRPAPMPPPRPPIRH